MSGTPSVATIELPYLQRFRDRHGHERLYYRRGDRRVALPGPSGSPEFLAAYQAAHGSHAAQEADKAARLIPGTMAALVASYRSSAAWKALRPETHRAYIPFLDDLVAQYHGHRVAALEARHVRQLVEKRAGTPASANRLLSILRILMRHAIDLDWRDTDATAGVRGIRYRTQSIETWTEEDIDAFWRTWPAGSRARLALALLLYTGQRRGDVIRLGRQHVRSARLHVVQGKTGARLSIPIHPDLAAEIAAIGHNHLTFLVTETGAPFASGNAFYNWFRWAAGKAGVSKPPHGLRSAAARRLAEAGCSTREIMSLTGHTTLPEVERYTRAADQAKLAQRAVARMPGLATRSLKSVNPDHSSADNNALMLPMVEPREPPQSGNIKKISRQPGSKARTK